MLRQEKEEFSFDFCSISKRHALTVARFNRAHGIKIVFYFPHFLVDKSIVLIVDCKLLNLFYSEQLELASAKV